MIRSGGYHLNGTATISTSWPAARNASRRPSPWTSAPPRMNGTWTVAIRIRIVKARWTTMDDRPWTIDDRQKTRLQSVQYGPSHCLEAACECLAQSSKLLQHPALF